VELCYRFAFDAAHRFTHFPAGHPNASVHGHSFEAEIALEGERDPRTGFVVDFARLFGQEEETRAEEAARLRMACEDWGFFQVVNHGIPEEIMEEIKRSVMGFFALPRPEKKALAQEPGGIEGYGQAFVVSEEQKLDWADMFYLVTQPPSYRHLRLWPSNPSTFK
jgi:hypothetical protein